MSATKAARNARKASNVVASDVVASSDVDTLDVVASSLVQPIGAPDLQAALDALTLDQKAAALALVQPIGAPVASSRAESIARFETIVEALGTEIDVQNRGIVANMVKRGSLVAQGLDEALSLSFNEKSRKADRAAALKILQAKADARVDTSSEVKADCDRWNRHYQLSRLFPESVNVASTNVMDKLTTLITRVESPGKWNAPETWEVKRHFDATRAAQMISDVVASSPTIAKVESLIDGLLGAPTMDDDAKSKPVDTNKAAEQMADRVQTAINELKIDPTTFFASLSSSMNKYGWKIENRPDVNGISTLRPVKAGR